MRRVAFSNNASAALDCLVHRGNPPSLAVDRPIQAISSLRRGQRAHGDQRSVPEPIPYPCPPPSDSPWTKRRLTEPRGRLRGPGIAPWAPVQPGNKKPADQRPPPERPPGLVSAAPAMSRRTPSRAPSLNKGLAGPRAPNSVASRHGQRGPDRIEAGRGGASGSLLRLPGQAGEEPQCLVHGHGVGEHLREVGANGVIPPHVGLP